MSRIPVSAIAILCTAGLPALAGPLDAPPAPPPVMIETALDPAFAGAYAGLSFGSLHGDIPTDLTLPDEDDSTAFGAFAGFNLQRGNLVFGGEARYLAFNGFGLSALASPPNSEDLSFLAFSSFGHEEDEEDFSNENENECEYNDEDYFCLPVGIDHVFDLRTRLGLVTGPAFFYAAAGWSWSEVNIATSSVGVDGWNAGIGVEMNLSDRYFVGADYTMRELSGTLGGGGVLEADLDTLTLRAGLRF